MSIKVFCVIDATNLPEMAHFQREALTQSLNDLCDEIRFCFLISKSDDKKFLKSNEEYIFFNQQVSFGNILTKLSQMRKENEFLIWTESNLFPSKGFLSSLFLNKSSNSILIPQNVFIFNSATGTKFYNQNNIDKNNFWKTGYFACFGFTPKLKLANNPIFQKNFGRSLRESFFQYFLFKKYKLKIIENSWSFGHQDCKSVSEIFNNSQHSAFYTPPKLIKRKGFKNALEILQEINRGSSPTFLQLNEQAQLEILEASKIDPRMRTLNSARLRTQEVLQPVSYESYIYEKIVHQIKGYDYIIILHQLRRGGAEKEAVLHLQAYCDLYPNKKVALVLTLSVNPDIAWQLPKQVKIVQFGKECVQQVGIDQQAYLLYRIIDQVNPKTIHIKCAYLGWRIVAEYGNLLSKKSKIIANIYCIDYNPLGFATSYAFTELPRAVPYINCLVADNNSVLEELKLIVPLKLTKKLHYPVETNKIAFVKKASYKLDNIVWCSRICRQKDINTLKSIAWLFPEIKFHVYGEITSNDQIFKQLSDFSNIIIWGIFDSIDEIKLNEYDAFLYTSYWDGLPNIILEAGIAGIPIISPNLSGIREILNHENSEIYEDLESLKNIIENWSTQTDRFAKVKRLHKSITSKHNWKKFMKDCRALYE